MTSPIRPRIKAVFAHVDNLETAIESYSRLLGIPVNRENLHGPIYVIPLENGFDLLLDDNRNNPPEAVRPTAMYDTDDIDAAHRHVTALDFEVLTDIQRYPDVCFFNFRDSSGNVAMVCQQLN